MRTVYGLSIATLIAACVPGLPTGELDPQSTGAAGTDGSGAGGMAASGNAGQGLASGGSGGGADWPVTCDPGCVPPPGCSNPVSSPSPVSGLETACTTLDPFEGRDGGWYVAAADGTMITPSPGNQFQVACTGAAGSCFSACISGRLSGGGYPWAMLGIALRKDARAYDVSQYRGISFFVTGSVGRNSNLSFRVPQVADTMVGNGDGACTQGCFDAYMTPLFDFRPQPVDWWEPRQIEFTELRQQGFGTPAPWDPTSVIGFHWQVSANSETVVDEPFMVCIDQVDLVR